jgi:hypothetical protein
MHVQIYDNKIIAPNKHGTRFLNQVFDFKYEDGDQLEIFKTYKWLTADVWFVYREPMEHLISALHTEIITKLNNSKDSNIQNVINDFVSQYGTTHWHPQLLQQLYDTWLRYNKNKFKIIELKNLSNLLIDLGYNIPEFNYSDYQFNDIPIKLTKENIVEIVKTDFPNEWNYLIKMVNIEKEFYNKLNNRIITPVIQKHKFI